MKYIFLTFSFFFISSLQAECSDLSYEECIYWSGYCEWNEEAGQCQEIGGGGNTDYGPYEFSSINENNGLRNGPEYMDGVLYYPIDAEPPLSSVVLTPGWGGGEFFASYGFLSMVIGPNDEINDSHQQRAQGLLDAIETIKEEYWRADSPLLGMVDTSRFIVSGYSMGGGASQVALMFEDITSNHSIVAAIALNPTIIFEDCDVCNDNEYCICLVPEFLDHGIPTLIIAGQNEINELPSYDGLLGQDIYENTPESTTKILYEVENGGHGSAESPYGDVLKKTLFWARYHLMEELSYCDSLLLTPSNASQFISTLECGNLPAYDVNGDGAVNNADFLMLVTIVLNESISSSDINYDLVVDVFDILTLSDFLEEISN